MTKVFTSQALCDNSVFGDPAFGTAKSCWRAAKTTDAASAAAPIANAPPPAPAAAPVTLPATNVGSSSTSGSTSTSQSVPTPESIKGKRIVGRIDATSGQVIENVHVVNHTGPCIVINGQSNVVIRDSEIGPCGDQTTDLDHSGIRILSGSTNITIERNVIHDAPALVSANAVVHPITIHKNLFYNVRGTQWAFQAIAFGETRSGTASTKITCNVIDDSLVERYPMAGGRERKVEDHISFYNAGGTSQFPVEIAYNRIRGYADGKGGESGTGMQLGDSPAGGGGSGSNVSGYFYVHDNIVKHTNGQGIALAGGVGSVVKDNKVDNRGSNLLSATGWPFGLRNFDTSKPASVTFSGNKGIGSLWAFDRDGHTAPPLSTAYASSGFQVTDSGGNDWQHAFTTDIWNDPPHSACVN